MNRRILPGILAIALALSMPVGAPMEETHSEAMPRSKSTCGPLLQSLHIGMVTGRACSHKGRSGTGNVSVYSANDLYVLAHVICGEAQGCPDEEQRYVGSVVLNRVKSSNFPDTIENVVFQPGQYACVRDGNYDREPTKANWENARWLLENGSLLPDYVVYQSRGRQGEGEYMRTNWHSYCY